MVLVPQPSQIDDALHAILFCTRHHIFCSLAVGLGKPAFMGIHGVDEIIRCVAPLARLNERGPIEGIRPARCPKLGGLAHGRASSFCGERTIARTR